MSARFLAHGRRCAGAIPLLLIVAALLALPPGEGAAQAPGPRGIVAAMELIDLGPAVLAGRTLAFKDISLNNAVQAVGSQPNLAVPWGEQGFIWKDGTFTSVPFFPGPVAPGSYSRPFDLNESGVAAGHGEMLFPVPGGFEGHLRAFRLDANGNLNVLNTPAGSGIGAGDAEGFAINNLGQIAGRWTPAGGQETACIWNGNLPLVIQPVGVLRSRAADINDAGQVVGQREVQGNLFRAFLWSGGSTVLLGTLGGAESAALGVNDQGQVVGTSNFSPVSPDFQAFRWQSGQMTGLPGFQGVATSINEPGNSVGYFTVGKGDNHAALWQGDTLVDLNDVIDPALGWVLNQAWAVNDAGQIAGWGTLAGEVRYFILTPGRVDLQIKAAADPPEAFALDNVYQSTPSGGQIVASRVDGNGESSFEVKVENDGMRTRTFFVRASSPNPPGWAANYTVDGLPIITAIRSRNGYQTRLLAHGESEIIRVVLTPLANQALVNPEGEALSAVDLSAYFAPSDRAAADAVRAVGQATVRADLLFRTGAKAEFQGGGVFDPTGASEALDLAIPRGGQGPVDLRLQNAGQIPWRFTLQGSRQPPQSWAVRFQRDGEDVTAAILGRTGLTLEALPPGGFVDLQLIMRPPGRGGPLTAMAQLGAFVQPPVARPNQDRVIVRARIEQPNTGPPVLHAPRVRPRELPAGGGSVNLGIRVQDREGVDRVTAAVALPGGGETLVVLQRQSGTPKDGVWTGQFLAPANDTGKAQVYTVVFTAVDVMGAPASSPPTEVTVAAAG